VVDLMSSTPRRLRSLHPLSTPTLKSTSKTYAVSIKFALSIEQEFTMLDALFLALGLGGFALMAMYARLCDRF
jgi:hypothetical protein